MAMWITPLTYSPVTELFSMYDVSCNLATSQASCVDTVFDTSTWSVVLLFLFSTNKMVLIILWHLYKSRYIYTVIPFYQVKILSNFPSRHTFKLYILTVNMLNFVHTFSVYMFLLYTPNCNKVVIVIEKSQMLNRN